eukprot:6871550-Alexandrium_andersonii.AAC.1
MDIAASPCVPAPAWPCAPSPSLVVGLAAASRVRRSGCLRQRVLHFERAILRRGVGQGNGIA